MTHAGRVNLCICWIKKKGSAWILHQKSTFLYVCAPFHLGIAKAAMAEAPWWQPAGWLSNE